MSDVRFVRILVAIDGSASADRALQFALRLVAPAGSVLLAHAIDRAEVIARCVTPYGGDPSPALDALDGDERRMFADAVARCDAAHVRVTTIARDGSAAHEIVETARAHAVDAIVMATHGRGGIERVVLGSVAAGVLRSSTVPTFVLHERIAAVPTLPFGTILVALDASPESIGAARFAIERAVRDGARLVFAHVAASAEENAEVRAHESCDAIVARARDTGVRVERLSLHGDRLNALSSAVERSHADLIVIGAHGRFPRLRIANMTEAIVRASTVPVLVVPVAKVAPASFIPSVRAMTT